MYKLFFIFAALIANSIFGIENSIISEMDANYCLKNYQSKFSKTQYQDVKDALEGSTPIRVMSYNVLSKSYDWMQKEENTWANRKERVVALIKNASPDVLCCQELTPDQINDLAVSLSDTYGVYAPLVEREDCQNELLGIFYKRDVLELSNGEKKEIGAVYYWEMFQVYCYQYYLKAELVNKKSNQVMTVFTTHTDFLSPDVRLATVDFVLKDAEEAAQKGPTIFAGDFNTLPSYLPDFFKTPFTPGIDGPYILQRISKKNFRNSSDIALIAHVGPMSTFSYSLEKMEPFSGCNIFGLVLDHIFVNPDKVSVLFHAIEPATVEGHFPSDHLPVIADVLIH